MWSRVVEVMLGCWLLISPFVFAHQPEDVGLWANDLACGSAIIVFGLFSWWRPTRHAHLLSVAVAGWLVAFAYREGLGGASPAAQNHMVLGLLLLMFAIIPNDAAQPPREWRGAVLDHSGQGAESSRQVP